MGRKKDAAMKRPAMELSAKTTCTITTNHVRASVLALLATTLQHFNDSGQANLRDSSQSGIGQAKDVRSSVHPLEKLRGLSVSLKCKAKQRNTELEGRGGGCLRHFAIKSFECTKNVHCCICGD